MIDIDAVIKALSSLITLNDEDLERFMPLIENAAASVCCELSSIVAASDTRVVFLAAARAYYYITCVTACADNVKSFTAGSVSLTVDGAAAISAAYGIMQAAEAACAGLLSPPSFTFRVV